MACSGQSGGHTVNFGSDLCPVQKRRDPKKWSRKLLFERRPAGDEVINVRPERDSAASGPNPVLVNTFALGKLRSVRKCGGARDFVAGNGDVHLPVDAFFELFKSLCSYVGEKWQHREFDGASVINVYCGRPLRYIVAANCMVGLVVPFESDPFCGKHDRLVRRLDNWIPGVSFCRSRTAFLDSRLKFFSRQ